MATENERAIRAQFEAARAEGRAEGAAAVEPGDLAALVAQWRDAPDDARGPLRSAIAAALDGSTTVRPDPLSAALATVDPADSDLAAKLRAALAPDPAPIVTAADALLLPAPDRVVWADALPPEDAAVCSVGEVAVLSASGGSGKSYLALHLALEAVAGRSPARACGLTVRPGPILMASYEDSPARMGARVRMLQGRPDAPDAPDLTALALVDDPSALWTPADRGGSGAVRTPAFYAIQRRADVLRPSLIVIDPISAAGAGLNLNEGGAARACMRDLARLSVDTGAGVLLISHDTKAARNEAKAGGNPGAGAVAGSGQWFDAARGVLYLHGAGARMLECVKCNHGRAGWGVELGEVGGAGGRPFRGFERRAWVADAEADRAAKATANRATKRPAKAGDTAGDGGGGAGKDAAAEPTGRPSP